MSEKIPGKVERVGRETLFRAYATDSRITLNESYNLIDKQPGDDQVPGGYPYTRGITKDGYREELWHRDIYAGFGNAEDSSERYRDLLAGGASGVNIALDLPTQLGYDSDHPDALAEVGKVGLAVDALPDVVDAFLGISLADAKTVFTVANGIGPIALAWFLALGQRQGVPPENYVVHLQNDPLKEFTGRGAFVLPLEASVQLACDVVEYVARHGYMHWKPIGICGSQYRWGGGSAYEEVGLAIASARYYIEELLRRGLSIDDFGPLLELHLAADMDFLEEAAKFRAGRRVWAKMMKNDYGARLPESQHLRVSLYTGGYRLTAQEPLNNAVRITLQALSAVLGGIQHLGTLSIDEALATPSAEAARLAIQTQNILAFETSLAAAADPLGGSYLVEALTDELESRISEVMTTIADQGGITKAIRSGYVQALIDDASYQYQVEIENQVRPVVGVNVLRQGDTDGTVVKTFRISRASAERQLKRLAEHRQSRDHGAVERALGEVQRTAEAKKNIVESLVAAVQSGATVGEVSDRLRSVFGTWDSDGVQL